MAGMVPPGADRARHRDTYLANLRHATQAAFAHGITILIEPINPRDMPGYFLSRRTMRTRSARKSARRT